MRSSILLALLTAGPAAGHETWLLPKTFTPTGGAVKLCLTSGMKFPAPDAPIKPDRPKHAKVRLAGPTTDLTDFESADHELVLTAALAKAGVAVAWVELKPKRFTLDDDQIEAYFREIHASDAVKKAWADAPKPRAWAETYTKHAKTVFRYGGGSDAGWKDPVGQGLEIVPAADPTAYAAGDQQTFRVLKAGKPFPGLAVGVATAAGPGAFATTDARGDVTVTLAKPGKVLLYGTDLRPPTTPGGDWTSDFTTLTLSVDDKR